MAVSVLSRLAAAAPAPVFCAAGIGGQPGVRALRCAQGLEIVPSPRQATVLVVAGAVPAAWRGRLRQVHDQVPEPRAVVWWSGDGVDGAMRRVLPDVVALEAGDPATRLRGLHADLLTGDRPSTATLGPRQNPTPWRDVGPHGQGGEGMMGGQPYGRGMAATGEDVRDGLALDRVPLRLGPFHPAIPPGLVLDAELQGDVIVEAMLHRPEGPLLGAPLPPSATGGLPRSPGGDRAAVGRLADLLVVAGLPERAERILRLARAGGVADHELRRARHSLRPLLMDVDASELGASDPDGPDLHELAAALVGLEWSVAVASLWLAAGADAEVLGP